MKKYILFALIAVVLVLASCQAPGVVPQAVTENPAVVETQAEETAKLSTVDTVKRFITCLDSHDTNGINALMAENKSMTLSEEDSATLTLIDCTELKADEDTAVVEVNFDVEIDERNMTSFEEGLYTWRFYLIKDNEGNWRIDNYGM